MIPVFPMSYIMTPTPLGVGHLISPRWLGEMWCFSLSLSQNNTSSIGYLGLKQPRKQV